MYPSEIIKCEHRLSVVAMVVVVVLVTQLIAPLSNSSPRSDPPPFKKGKTAAIKMIDPIKKKVFRPSHGSFSPRD
jgi:hypothetical protein